MPRRPPLVIGHRGAPGYRPEHTRSSYELAIAQGADAVEPDVVVSQDGVLVVRHENELGATTDVAARPGFADRRTTKTVDGVAVHGWFTEDFTWEELTTLRAREPLPAVRPGSAAFDGEEPIFRLADVLDLARAAPAGREVGVVVELKHPSYFASLGWDVATMVADALVEAAGDLPIVVESFELGVLERIRAGGLPATFVFLLDRSGRPVDQDRDFAGFASPEGLGSLAGRVDGVSVDRRMILERPQLVADAHERGLDVFTWTCRAENAFLTPPFQGPGGDDAFGDYAGEWALLRDAGVDGVFVDQPDLGVDVFRGPTPERPAR